MDETAKIYNQLLKFESRKKRQEPYPIHKKLYFTSKNQSLMDWLVSQIPFSNKDYILDAGCGTGFTLFYLHKLFGCRGLGISISPDEIKYAQKACEDRNLDPYFEFKHEDYQNHHSGPYSKIITIESLKHAPDLKKSIKNLLGMLMKRGRMIIIDDFVIAESEEFIKQKKLWNSPGFTNIEIYKEIINSSGSFEYRVIDMTSFVHSRPIWILNLLYFILSIIKNITPRKVVRNIDTYLGGLMLEKLYANKQVKYMALLIEKKIQKYD